MCVYVYIYIYTSYIERVPMYNIYIYIYILYMYILYPRNKSSM